ncbi:esterase family protein [Paenibacillus sp. NFR01]|uniref:alpha/beta hydrolase n=1 Tax=Paenibacillus sp. NFR01 TaxID=1566279 RepID=UPI0008ABA4A7|nr:alpha/beta hydrolase-fold protein [Paenibacillus sp. NFR01]SEU20518.1 Enterochelin esterase [Paenibacillus sp. NFR01]
MDKDNQELGWQAPPPEGYDRQRNNINRGTIRIVEYPSQTVGGIRQAMVYTPPGYSAVQKYGVLYLLHGIGGDEQEWYAHGSPQTILDNLHADGLLKPMIVVFPNGRAMLNDRAEGDLFAPDKLQAFERFETDLFQELIPFIEAHYSVHTDRMHRGLAGLSMGGGQALNIGLSHPERFAWVGAFSPAPNTREPHLLAPEPLKTAEMLRLLWISCGDQDSLKYVSDRTHAYLAEQGVPHLWLEEPGDHDWPVWKNGLYQLAKRIF